MKVGPFLVLSVCSQLAGGVKTAGFASSHIVCVELVSVKLKPTLVLEYKYRTCYCRRTVVVVTGVGNGMVVLQRRREKLGGLSCQFSE